MGLSIDPAVFENDGEVYDIFAVGAELADWRTLVGALADAPWQVEFEEENGCTLDDLAAMDDTEFQRVLFEQADDKVTPVLRLVQPGHITFSCFFFDVEDLEFTFHPSAVETEDDIGTVRDVIVWLAHTIHKRVIMLRETSAWPIEPEWALVDYRPDEALDVRRLGTLGP